MFQVLANHWSFLNIQSSMKLLDYSTVPEPDCYANQSTSLTPCGLCTKPATKLDTATGQTSDTYVYTFRHDGDGWLCDSNT